MRGFAVLQQYLWTLEFFAAKHLTTLQDVFGQIVFHLIVTKYRFTELDAVL